MTFCWFVPADSILVVYSGFLQCVFLILKPKCRNNTLQFYKRSSAGLFFSSVREAGGFRQRISLFSLENLLVHIFYAWQTHCSSSAVRTTEHGDNAHRETNCTVQTHNPLLNNWCIWFPLLHIPKKKKSLILKDCDLVLFYSESESVSSTGFKAKNLLPTNTLPAHPPTPPTHRTPTLPFPLCLFSTFH